MRFGVLGPLTVWTSAGEPVAIPGLKVRAVLADLIVHEGRPVSTGRLVEDLWGADTPANPAGALQVRVSQLRRALEDAERGGRELVVSRPPGYLLHADPDAVDAWRFTALAARAERTEDPGTRAGLLADALALWRGPALADFADDEFGRAAATRLEEQRLAALELHAEARLALGEHSLLAGELGDLVARYPLRERLRAVHIRALYRAGRQSEALASYADLRERLADELGLAPGPELVALQQAVLEQDLAPAAKPRRPRTNLPAALTELVGREEAVAELRGLLRTARLVTLTGPGGVGKTRLAQETASQSDMADGVWLVELATLADAVGGLVCGGLLVADRVADAVLAVLDIRDAEPVSAADKLVSALSSRHVLLVLDNCEHLVEAVAELAEKLLRAAPGLRILATSREPLGVPGEVVWEVPPLDVPDGGTDLERYSAVRLFVTRAAAAVRGFTLDDDNRAAVAQLCTRLDGIPLALELAATRVRTLGVHGLVERLDDRFRLLAAGHRGAPPRQRTLAAVIDWSWQLLGEPERAVLRRLAVHVGGCTLDAADATCAGPYVPATDVMGLLARLVDRSFVVMVDRPDGPRFRLLETVAAYCLDRLGEAGELDEVRARHAEYYTELAVRADPYLRGPEQPKWLRRLDAESGNLHAALDSVRLTNALTWYWFLRGRLAEARRSLAAALAADADADAGQRALADAWRAGFAMLQGEHGIRADAVESIPDPGARARTRWFLAFAEPDVPGAERVLNQALATFEEIGDRWGTATALATRAKLAHARGDTASLERDARRSAELFRTLGDRWGVLQATEWLAGLAEMTGDYESATQLHREGLRMAEELELWPDVAGRLCWLGWIALQLDDQARARDLAEQALRLAVEQDSRSTTVFAVLVLGFSARRAGKLDVAEAHLRGLLDAADREDVSANALHLPMVLTELGIIAELRGDAEAAREAHLEAFDIALPQGASRDVAFAVVGMAGAAALAGRHTEAAQLLGAADATRRPLGLPLDPEERDQLTRITETVRTALGTEVFATEYDHGAETDARTLRTALFGRGAAR